MKRSILLLFIFNIVSYVFASKDPLDSAFTTFEKGQATTKTTIATALDSAIQQRELEEHRFYAKQYQYYQKSLDHRYATFSWQATSTKLIFLLVIGIVLCGLLFSFIHFKNALKQHEKNPNLTAEASSLEVSMQGVKINSSVIGLIILALSLGFFYLYLVYVYPINQVKLDNEPQKTATEQTK